MPSTALTVSFGARFAEEFPRFPTDQQDKILAFVEQFERHGLNDFAKFEGKIARSGADLDDDDPLKAFCENNNLWHYHIGIPEYEERHEKYKTSDWVLHFMWPEKNHIVLVDIYSHYTSDGGFYLPSEGYLKQA